MKKIAVLVADFNPDITHGLRDGAVHVLNEHRMDYVLFQAPGAFEIPLLAKLLAKSGKYSAIIALGAVIKGDTAHFEFVSLGACIGILQASLETEVPISFGVLTTYTDEQAEMRSKNDSHNKGREAASAVLQSLKFIREI